MANAEGRQLTNLRYHVFKYLTTSLEMVETYNMSCNWPTYKHGCSMLGSLSSSDSKALWELKEILNNNIAARSKAESDKMVIV